MANGQVLCGRAGLPLYGKNGTLLYAASVSMSVDVVISWSGGSDVDICGLYNVVGGSVGYNHDSSINANGFSAAWDGDNTSGGPERVHLAYSGNRSSLADVHFDIHTNWYAVGGGATGGGPATVTATDARGTVKSFTVMPGTSKGRAANTGDPGVRINFNVNGTLKSLTAC